MCFYKIILYLVIWGTVSAGDAPFTVQEAQKVKQILHEMVTILEGNHREILDMEEVLSRTGTELRKARIKENIKRKMLSFRERIKDLKKLRDSFATQNAFKEFIISIDDRLKVMEENLILIQNIYFPAILEGEIEEKKIVEVNEPTFIDPEDPRYSMNEDQQKLAHAIQKTRNLMDLRKSREPLNDGFDAFVGDLDKNLKKEDLPDRNVIPVLGKNTLDAFHQQLEASQTRDPLFDWNMERSDQDFRNFFQDIEGLDKDATVNRRIVTGFPNVDSPDGPQSPMESEISMTYQKGIIRKDLSPSDIIHRQESLAWERKDESFLKRLQAQRVYNQSEDFWQGEQLMVERMRERTKTQIYSSPGSFEAVGNASVTHLENFEEAKASSYKVNPDVSFFSSDSAPQVHEVEAISQKSLEHHEIMPVTVQMVDENDQPFVDFILDFVLVNQPGIEAKFVEGKEFQKARSLTNQNGEATVHLLAIKKDSSFEVQKNLLQDPEGKIYCEVRLVPRP